MSRTPGGGVDPVAWFNENKDELLALANSDPVRFASVCVGGDSIVAFVENYPDVAAATHQALHDEALRLGEASALCGVVLIVEPGLVLIVGPLATLFAALSYICDCLYKGKPIDAGVLNGAAATVNSLAGAPLDVATAEKIAAVAGYAAPGALNMVSTSQILDTLTATLLQDLVAKVGADKLEADVLSFSAAGIPHYVALKVGLFLYDWRKAGRPTNFYVVTSLFSKRHSIPVDVFHQFEALTHDMKPNQAIIDVVHNNPALSQTEQHIVRSPVGGAGSAAAMKPKPKPKKTGYMTPAQQMLHGGGLAPHPGNTNTNTGTGTPAPTAHTDSAPPAPVTKSRTLIYVAAAIGGLVVVGGGIALLTSKKKAA